MQKKIILIMNTLFLFTTSLGADYDDWTDRINEIAVSLNYPILYTEAKQLSDTIKESLRIVTEFSDGLSDEQKDGLVTNLVINYIDRMTNNLTEEVELIES